MCPLGRQKTGDCLPDIFEVGGRPSCSACRSLAQYSFATDFDIAQNAVVARFSLACQRCHTLESMNLTVPKELGRLEADAEMKAAIADVLGE